ncbi:MAG TPA: hypothetical protein VNJ04_03345 [Gemmatimonadaceae bacterium]|nr:hypothetical protein [Gemmatimonadaceae bacterium]
MAEGVEPVRYLCAPSFRASTLTVFSAGAGEVDESPDGIDGGTGEGCWAASKAGKTIVNAAGARKPSLIYASS